MWLSLKMEVVVLVFRRIRERRGLRGVISKAASKLVAVTVCIAKDGGFWSFGGHNVAVFQFSLFRF